MDEDFESKHCLEATIEDGQGGDVQVVYISVPDSEDSQVLDISNLLVQEGIQIVETQVAEGSGQEVPVQTLSTSLLLDENGTLSDQTTTQSAHALLNLSKSHGRSPTCGQLKVVSMLDPAVKTEEVLESETVELAPASGTATYIVDENGTMIPLGQYRPSGETGYVHVEEADMSTIAICTCWCGKEFISQDDLDKHKAIHDKPRTRGTAQLKCELCAEVFPSQSKLANHHRVHHPDGMPWECPICFRRFSKKLGLKVHLRAHSGLKQHKCSFCDRSFSYKNALLRHMKLHTKDKPYKCSICGEGFTHLWAMRRHRAIHKPASLYQCDICSKTFKQKQTLFIHARIHTGHKPYSCEICRKSFTLKSSLNQHLRIHTGERPKICTLCNKAFRQTSTLKSHMKLHTHMKPHKCRYCKTRFAAHDEMLEHELVHLKNKSWQCDECGMRFRNQSLLSRHVRKHTNERPFQCKICGKSFSQSGSLQSHMRTHTKEKPYQCRLCPKTYTTSGTLLIHIRRAHGLEAKKVKDVFPSTNYIEDQKIFTIRSHVPMNRENTSTGTSAPSNDEIEVKTEISPDSVIVKDGDIVLEDFIADGDDIISHDGNVLIQRINLDAKGCDVESPDQPQEVEGHQNTDGEESRSLLGADDEERAKKGLEILADEKKGDEEESTSGGQTVGYSTVKELMTKRQIKPCSLTLMNIDGFSRYKVIDMENEKENSLYAQARQEAALGLAELSLVGGIVVSEKRAGTTSRTVAREVEDNRSEDPNVTKIILSKEGGVMNSQDPHQCPECKRIFGRKSIMVEHRRIHTDEKPYECDFCFIRFRQSAQLSSHIRNKHTKEKKYQCSFCQNRFLSRGITIRHINFHHKLKVRLCESIDPHWTVDEAILCDDKHEVVVVKQEPNDKEEKPVKVISVTTSTKPTADSSNSTDANQLEAENDVNVTLQQSDLQDSIKAESDPSSLKEQVSECTENERSNRHVVVLDEANMNLNSQDDELDMDIKAAIEETILCSTNKNDTLVKMETEGELTVVPSEVVELVATNTKKDGAVSGDSSSEGKLLKTESIQDGSFDDESRLVCETCAMQFRGISSLRWHLRKVHQTTLAESDVSFVYEDEDPEDKAKGSANYPLENEGEEHLEITVANTQGTESGKESEGDLCAFPVHSKNSVTKSSLKCCICCVCFGSRMELEEHLKNHGIDEVEAAGMHRCDTCGVVMKNSQQISKHILKTHGIENIYGCSICDKEFLQESSVLRHMKFFHKWEMKIRGEGNIPVLLKPAPPSLHASGPLECMKRKDKARKENASKRARKGGLKVSSREENNVTFISLEVGDLEGLQLYREDGKKVKFEVVKSTNEMTTLRIKDFETDELSETEKEYVNDLSVIGNLVAQNLESGVKTESDEVSSGIDTQPDVSHSVVDLKASDCIDSLNIDSFQKGQSSAKCASNDKHVTTLVVRPEALPVIGKSDNPMSVSSLPHTIHTTPNSSDAIAIAATTDKKFTVKVVDDKKLSKDTLCTAQDSPENFDADLSKEESSACDVVKTPSEKEELEGGNVIVESVPDSPEASAQNKQQNVTKIKTISVLDKSLVKDGMNKATGALLKTSSKQGDQKITDLKSSSNSSKSQSPEFTSLSKKEVASDAACHRTPKAKGGKSKQKVPLEEDESDSLSSNKKVTSPKYKVSQLTKEKNESLTQQERRSSSGRLIKRKRFSDEEPPLSRSYKSPRK